ncbi:MAG: type I restriction enzyme HsdR N-terminal domain-containing protein [Bacteroidales bacterium]|nr:type I restriction enzyme HsdR N-terminal domain-containing protein [Bacteroidales bacterium]
MAEKSSNKVWDPLRRRQVSLTPEERVRQWFIGVLAQECGIPMHMMMSEAAFSLGDKNYRADIIVYRRDLSPWVVVECKRPEVALDEAVLDQAIRYNMVLGVDFIIITNGNGTLCLERGEDGTYAPVEVLPLWKNLQ